MSQIQNTQHKQIENSHSKTVKKKKIPKQRVKELSPAGLADLKKLARPPKLVTSESATGDVKIDVVNPLKDLLKMKGMRGWGNIRVWLWYAATPATSAAASPQAPVNRIRPSDSTEFTLLASLYDEYRAVATKTYWASAISVGPSIAVDSVMIYDPTNNTALAGITEGLVASRHRLIRNPNSYSNPTAVTGDGLYQMELKFPTGPQVESSAGIPGPGMWIETLVTSYDAGWFKHYIAAPSATVTTTLTQYIGILTEFRARS